MRGPNVQRSSEKFTASPDDATLTITMDDYGYALRTGRGNDLKYWYRNPTTDKLYAGPKPRPALLSARPKAVAHPDPEGIEPCPWEGLGRTANHELIAIPGPPEVLYNKLGLTSAEDIHPREDLGTMRALRYLQDNVTQTTPMTAAWLRKLHKIAFGDLYAWAGEYRTVNIAKEGKRAFSAWCQWQHIPATMEELERNYLRKHTPISPKHVEDVPRRVAILISEFLLVHPFREGNGRIAQMMGNWVALQAGLPTIAYGIDEDTEAKDAYIAALQQGYNQNYAPMERFVHEGVERSLKALRRLKLEPPPPGESDNARE